MSCPWPRYVKYLFTDEDGEVVTAFRCRICGTVTLDKSGCACDRPKKKPQPYGSIPPLVDPRLAGLGFENHEASSRREPLRSHMDKKLKGEGK